MYAAGYDVKSVEGFAKTMSDFDSIVGFKFLRGIHLNGSPHKDSPIITLNAHA